MVALKGKTIFDWQAVSHCLIQKQAAVEEKIKELEVQKSALKITEFQLISVFKNLTLTLR